MNDTVKRKTLRYTCFVLMTTVVTLITTGCNSVNTAKAKNYFVLRNTAPHTSVSGVPTVSIRQVKLPSYLNQQGIVRQLDNGQINVSYADLWAEKLSEAVPTLLSENLATQLNQPIEIHPLPPGIRVKQVIEVNISRFIASREALTLVASYRLVQPNQLRTYPFQATLPLADTQTTTLVTAYATALGQLSTDIAQKLQKK